MQDTRFQFNRACEGVRWLYGTTCINMVFSNSSDGSVNYLSSIVDPRSTDGFRKRDRTSQHIRPLMSSDCDSIPQWMGDGKMSSKSKSLLTRRKDVVMGRGDFSRVAAPPRHMAETQTG